MMSCGCSYSLRITSSKSICLDFLALNKKKGYGYEKLATEETDEEEIEPILIRDPHEVSFAKPPELNFLHKIAFILSGLAIFTCWTSVSFLVTFWTDNYGKSIWSSFIISYNIPGLPVLFLQLLTDSKMESKIGVYSSHLLRNGLVMALLLFVTISIPFVQAAEMKGVLIFMVVMIGVLVGMGSGWIFSLGSKIPQASGYLLIGQGLATLIVLGGHLAFPIDPKHQSKRDMLFYFSYCGAFILLGIIAFILLMKSKLIKAQYNDKQLISSLNSIPESSEELSMSESSLSSVLKSVWVIGISMVINNFTIVALVGLLNFLPSSSGNKELPSIVLYVTSIASLAGNEISILIDKWTFQGQSALLIFSCVRALIVPFVIVYMRVKFWLNDYFILVVLGLFAMTGTFAIGKCYRIASKYAKGNEGKASLWMNIFLYVGVYLGATIPFWLPKLVRK